MSGSGSDENGSRMNAQEGPDEGHSKLQFVRAILAQEAKNVNSNGYTGGTTDMPCRRL